MQQCRWRSSKRDRHLTVFFTNLRNLVCAPLKILSTIEIEPFYNALNIHHATDHKHYYLDWKREERPHA